MHLRQRNWAAAVAALAVAALLSAGCGDGSPDESERRVADFARSVSAAYNCMPSDARGRYDRIARRLERVGAPILARTRDRTAAEQDQALRADPEYARLSVRASRLLARHLPRGDDYDAECYRRESERHDRRVGRSGGE